MSISPISKTRVCSNVFLRVVETRQCLVSTMLSGMAMFLWCVPTIYILARGRDEAVPRLYDAVWHGDVSMVRSNDLYSCAW